VSQNFLFLTMIIPSFCCISFTLDSDFLKRINEVDAYGRSGLIYAANGGHIECAKLLLDHVRRTS